MSLLISKDTILDEAAAGRPLSKALELLALVGPKDQSPSAKNMREYCYAVEKGEDPEPCSVDPAELLHAIAFTLCAEHGSGLIGPEVVQSFTVLSEVCRLALERDRNASIVSAVEKYFNFLGGPDFGEQVWDMLDAALSSDLMDEARDRQMALSICRGLVEIHDVYSQSIPGKSLAQSD